MATIEQKIFDLAIDKNYQKYLDKSHIEYYKKLFDIPVSKLNVSQKIKIHQAWTATTARFIADMQISIKSKAFLLSVLKVGFRFKRQKNALWAIIFEAQRNGNHQFDEWFNRHNIRCREAV